MVNPKTKALVAAIAALDDEAVSWLALAMLESAMMHGATAQVWPDGLGGFNDRAGIERARTAAKNYIDKARQ